MLEQDLVTYLSANGELTGMISDRLYPLVLPQSPTLPAVVYQEIDYAPVVSQSGSSAIEDVRFQFKCWSTTLLEARQVRDILQRALSGYRGYIGSKEITSFVENGRSGYDGETGLSYAMIDARIWHQE